MLTATKDQQALLLRLSELDLQISRTSNQLKAAESSPEIDSLRRQTLEAAEELLSASANLEHLQDELVKIISDIELVVARVIQDEAKAKAVNSERELKAVELELASLRNRKSNLEDAELGLMEQIEASEVSVKEVSQKRAALNLSLEEELRKQGGHSINLGAQIAELTSKRNSLVGELDSSLVSAYKSKAQRGVAVGQTLGRDCSACRLAINGVEFDAMMHLPADALPTCPNCDAFIIR